MLSSFYRKVPSIWIWPWHGETIYDRTDFSPGPSRHNSPLPFHYLHSSISQERVKNCICLWSQRFINNYVLFNKYRTLQYKCETSLEMATFWRSSGGRLFALCHRQMLVHGRSLSKHPSSNVKEGYAFGTFFKMCVRIIWLEILGIFRMKSSTVSLEISIHRRKCNHHHQNLMFFVILHLCLCPAFESIDRIKICRSTKKVTRLI